MTGNRLRNIARACEARFPRLWRSRPVQLIRLLFAGDLQQLSYGLPVRTADLLDLRANGFRDIERPVFFLSTGRCGTKFLTLLLKKDRRLVVLHAPDPRLTLQAQVAHAALAHAPETRSGKLLRDCLGELFCVARERQLLLTHQAGKRLVETNNSVTFFAPVIAELLPQSVFVHVHRHPGEFVRSGVRRGWYTDVSPLDLGRPRPLPGAPEYEQWSGFTAVEKIGWLWRETNGFIDRFTNSQTQDRVLRLGLNQIDQGQLEALLSFTGARVSAGLVRRLLRREPRPNAQTQGAFPPYQQWTSEQKTDLRNVCGELASQYGYAL